MKALTTFLMLCVFTTALVAQDLGPQKTEVASTSTATAAPTYYFAYRNWGSGFRFKGKTPAQTNAIIKKAFAEMSAVSRADFKPWTGRGPYHIIIEFRQVVGQRNAGGQFEAPKTLVLSSGRDFKLNAAPWRVRIAHTLVQHETFHFLRYRASPAADQWAHSTDRSCVFNINGTARYFCPAEVHWMQRRWGKPPQKFMPVDKALHWAILKPKRKKLADAWAVSRSLVDKRKPWLDERIHQKEIRDNSTDPAIRQAAQQKINALNVKIRDINPKIVAARDKALAIKAANKKDEDKWKALIARWKNVPMAK